MEKQDIPVLLLTGYLGSGKTTLVNRILSNRKGIRFAVIVNDLGEVNIDADLIQSGGVVSAVRAVVPLHAGCVPALALHRSDAALRRTGRDRLLRRPEKSDFPSPEKGSVQGGGAAACRCDRTAFREGRGSRRNGPPIPLRRKNDRF